MNKHMTPNKPVLIKNMCADWNVHDDGITGEEETCYLKDHKFQSSHPTKSNTTCNNVNINVKQGRKTQ